MGADVADFSTQTIAVLMDQVHRRKAQIDSRRPREGEMGFLVRRKLTAKRSEIALIVSFLCDFQLFGRSYCILQPRYFHEMPQNSGVLVAPLVETRDIAPNAEKPGDIDILIIPYEGDELILHRSMAIEVKAVRASFAKQGRSPNEYGFSQAAALISIGFPYVTVAHLIVSDRSPRSGWRKMMGAVVLNSDGELGEFMEEDLDAMPADLIQRVYGRLERNSRSSTIGLLAAYINHPQITESESGRVIWMPDGREPAQNGFSEPLMDAIERYYLRNSSNFIAIPRYDPTD